MGCFSVPWEGEGVSQRPRSQVIPVSQQQSPRDVSIDKIPVDIANTQSGEIDPVDVPDEIESISRGLAGEQPPTNPLVVLKAARWWYLHGKGGADPAFQWAIEWTRHLAADTPTTSSGSTSSSSTSSRSASLTNATSSADRQTRFLNAPEGCGASLADAVAVNVIR